MSVNNVSRLGIVAAIVVVVIMFGISKMGNNNRMVEQKEAEMMAKEKMEQQEMADKKLMEEKESMMKNETTNTDSMIKTGDIVTMDKTDKVVKGLYEAYAPEKLARAETGDVVLFFHAGWCPSCRGLNGDIEKNISSIPAGVSILKLDYDKEKDLKKKYGVTYQHTLVQVDKDGNLIKKWSGSPTLTKLVSEIK